MFQSIIIDNELKNYIESLDYEYQSRKDLIVFMLANNMNINTESFQKYQNEMTEYFIKFNIAKQELEKKYIKPVIGDHVVNWSLDYATNTLSIEEIADEL